VHDTTAPPSGRSRRTTDIANQYSPASRRHGYSSVKPARVPPSTPIIPLTAAAAYGASPAAWRQASRKLSPTPSPADMGHAGPSDARVQLVLTAMTRPSLSRTATALLSDARIAERRASLARSSATRLANLRKPRRRSIMPAA